MYELHDGKAVISLMVGFRLSSHPFHNFRPIIYFVYHFVYLSSYARTDIRSFLICNERTLLQCLNPQKWFSELGCCGDIRTHAGA